MVAFSITDRDSFEKIASWKKKVEYECGSIPMILVQNKMDLVNKRVVSQEEADAVSRYLGMPLFRTSVKENINVESGKPFLMSSNISALFGSRRLGVHRVTVKCLLCV